MIIANIEKESSCLCETIDTTTNNDSKSNESNVRVVEMDGNIFKVKKEFATEGRTILEGIVSMLLDRMDREIQASNV